MSPSSLAKGSEGGETLAEFARPNEEERSIPPKRDGQSLFLVGVDGSRSAWRALHYAIGLRRLQPGRLLAIYAVQIPAYSLVGNDSLRIPAADSTYCDLEGSAFGAGQIGDAVRELASESCVAVEYAWVDDQPISALVRTASAYRADLVVVGGAGRASKSNRRIIDSVEAGILRKCICPVTVVP
jgi:nucleotide-binding universal stress UspA family protein